jgi:DNA-3-methyladenine glycosylase I
MPKTPSDTPARCPWPGTDPLYLAYHDREWGVPVRQDRLLFEFLVLEGMQAGLSWLTVLRKRPRFRQVFEGFDPEAVARFDGGRIEALLADPGIIRNRSKVLAAVGNARCVLELRERGMTLSEFLWSFTDGRVVRNRWRQSVQVPTETAASRAMSRELKRLGFRFVGPTICYAFMQAVGMVNDHLVDCFRHRELGG